MALFLVFGAGSVLFWAYFRFRRQPVPAASPRVKSGQGGSGMKRLIVGAAMAALVGGCGGGASDTPGATQTSSATSATTGGGTGQPGGQPPQYQAGAGNATVVVDAVDHPISGATCSLVSGDAGGISASKFSFVAGTAFQPGWLDIELTDLSSPIHDGEYRTGLSTVALQVADTDLLVGGLTITLQNGITAGSFSGTSAGNNPQPVSGTFTC
jgi:hypothetical protein